MSNKEMNTLFTGLIVLFWLSIFLTVTVSISIIFGSIIFGLILGIAAVATPLIKFWSAWSINPANQEILYTKEALTGTIRFYRQGLNLRSPTEKQVTGDLNSGKIMINKTITEEDDKDSIYTCLPDNAVVRFDWLFSWWPDVIDKNGEIKRDNCLLFIKTSDDIKKKDLRGKLESYLTLVSTVASSEDVRKGIDEITYNVAHLVFLPEGIPCDVERNHGVMVGTPRFLGVLDTPDVQKLRGNVQRAALLKKVAEELGRKPVDGKYVIDEEVMVAAGLVPKTVLDIRTQPGVKTIVIPGLPGVK